MRHRKEIPENREYTVFAGVYDTFMKDIPYEDWACFIKERLLENGISEGLVCDLGCGSGIMTNLLSDAGYDMTGIDNSSSMLQVAAEKKGDRDILYLDQDLTEFELYGTMRAFISTCDTLNYITDKKDLKKIFDLVNNYLDPGGLFIFDMHTVAYYERLGDMVFGDASEEAAYIWANSYDKKKRINVYDLTLFTGEDDGRYVRSSEVHVEKAYSIVDIKRMIRKSGLELIGMYADYTKKKPGRKSERIVYITKLPDETVKKISADI